MLARKEFNFLTLIFHNKCFCFVAETDIIGAETDTIGGETDTIGAKKAGLFHIRGNFK